jgi:hypothetical protein
MLAHLAAKNKTCRGRENPLSMKPPAARRVCRSVRPGLSRLRETVTVPRLSVPEPLPRTASRAACSSGAQTRPGHPPVPRKPETLSESNWHSPRPSDPSVQSAGRRIASPFRPPSSRKVPCALPAAFSCPGRGLPEAQKYSCWPRPGAHFRHFHRSQSRRPPPTPRVTRAPGAQAKAPPGYGRLRAGRKQFFWGGGGDPAAPYRGNGQPLAMAMTG